MFIHFCFCFVLKLNSSGVFKHYIVLRKTPCDLVYFLHLFLINPAEVICYCYYLVILLKTLISSSSITSNGNNGNFKFAPKFRPSSKSGFDEWRRSLDQNFVSKF